MIQYLKGTETTDANIFKAFSIGFSDYIMKFTMSQPDFIARFFGPEDNKRKYTVVALDDEIPIGIVMGGIKIYKGVKTMRCGAICIAPNYRGKGISDELMRLHQEMAVAENCQQMMLEVIVGNDRAINFYKDKGYYKVYEIQYYSHHGHLPVTSDHYQIDLLSRETLMKHINISELEPINWQNTFDYVDQLSKINYFGVYNGTQLIGFITIDENGKIYHLWTRPEYRFKGIATALLAYAKRTLSLEVVNISFINRASILAFVIKLGFKPLDFYQYEMYKWPESE